MKTKPIVAITCLALVTIVVFLVLEKLQQRSEPIRVSVRDGSGLEGAEILNSAYFLSSELPVEIAFHGTNRKPDWITAMSREVVANMPCDMMSLEIRGSEISINEEVLQEGELRSRLLTYAESARLTDSVPLMLVAARDDTSGIQLVSLFHLLRDSRISFIIPTHTFDAANKAAMATRNSL